MSEKQLTGSKIHLQAHLAEADSEADEERDDEDEGVDGPQPGPICRSRHQAGDNTLLQKKKNHTEEFPRQERMSFGQVELMQSQLSGVSVVELASTRKLAWCRIFLLSRDRSLAKLTCSIYWVCLVPCKFWLSSKIY